MTATQTTDRIAHELGLTGRLTINGLDGSVELLGTDGSEVVVHGTGRRPLDADFTIRRKPDELKLTAVEADGLRGFLRVRERCQAIRVEVPRGTRVTVITASGRIRADGIVGDQRYRTVSGEIVVGGVGGQADLETISGDVHVAASGWLELDARTVSGDLHVRAAVIRALTASTTSGSLTVDGRFEGAGPHTISSVSGDVRLAPHGPIRVEGSTVSGDVHSPLPHRASGRPGQRSIELGTGGPLVAFRSISGDLDVVAESGPDGASSGKAAGSGDTDLTDLPHAEVARLTILHEVEAGTIDVAEAERRLAAIDAQTSRISFGVAATAVPGGSDLGWVRRV